MGISPHSRWVAKTRQEEREKRDESLSALKTSAETPAATEQLNQAVLPPRPAAEKIEAEKHTRGLRSLFQKRHGRRMGKNEVDESPEPPLGQDISDRPPPLVSAGTFAQLKERATEPNHGVVRYSQISQTKGEPRVIEPEAPKPSPTPPPYLASNKQTELPIHQECCAPHPEYSRLFERYGQKYGIDPNLLAAITRKESDFDHRAVSNRGATGLMQLMPETAQDMNVHNVHNPEENIRGGTKYLRFLLDKFNDVKLALAAYNAGPGNVERFGGVPPFPETQEYVGKVLAYYTEYSERSKNSHT